MSDLPEPLVTADIDLKGFPGFVLDVEMLLASELIALATPEQIAAALMLWCRAWQQTPHGSLPNDERVLAAFSKSKNWKRVREMALRGFVLCSDGRLYHKTLCKKVIEAWDRRVAYEKKREKDAERLREWREKKHNGNTNGNAFETRFNDETKSVRSEEKRSEGNNDSVPNGTGGEPPKLSEEEATKLTKDELWSVGKSLLVESGMPPKQCGSFVGKLCKDYGDDIVIEAVRSAVVTRPADPVSFLKAACMARKGEGGKSLIPWHATDTGVIAKGAEFGLSPNRGERMVDFKARVIAALGKKDNPPAAAAAAPAPSPTPTPPPSAGSAEQIPVDPRQFKPDGVGPLKDLLKGKAA